MDETLDWMYEFDDSVFDDTIEANDTSAITGFENNTETSTETTSPLEANETVNEIEADNNISDDFFTNFTPTINFSMARSAGPSSMSNDATSKGDKPTGGTKDDDDKDVDLNDYYGGGKTDGDDPNNQGGYGSNWGGGGGTDDDKDIDLDDYYGGGKTDGDDDDDDDYGSWTDKDRAEAAKEVAEALGKESESAATEAELAKQSKEKADEDARLKADEVQKAQDEYNQIQSQFESIKAGIASGAGAGTEESKKAQEATAVAATMYGWFSKEYRKAVRKEKEIDAKEYDRVLAAKKAAEAKLKSAEAAANQAATAKYEANKAYIEAEKKAEEALAKTQAAGKYAGTLADEAKEAYERAQEKHKEWEQKVNGGDSTTSDKDSAVNNPVTFDLAKTLADAGAKMTEKEYGQVADFVAAHPEMASIINGGLTNAEKHTIGNVIAGIQAINEGNYLTAVKELAQGFGMTLVSAFQLISTGIYGAGARILGIIKSFMENPNINYTNQSEDFKTFKEMRDEYDGDSSELQALYKTAKGTTDQKQTFDYMKDNAATSVGEYNEGLVEDVNKVVSDASRKVIHYSPYVLEAVKKWR